MSGPPTHLVVGHVNRPHGTKGELMVWPLTDHPEGVYAPGVALLLAAGEEPLPDPTSPPLRVDSARPFRKGYLVKFHGVESRDDAQRLQGRYLVQAVEDLPELEEGEIFYHELLGMRVFTPDGREVGQVEEVYELRPAHMLEVRGARGTVLIPFTEAIVREVDAEARRMVVDPPVGLLDL